MIYGCDISGWQPGNVNLSGMDFVYVKATQGTYKVNANHDAQVAQARAEGKVVGHYHFPAWGNPQAEAQAFVSASGWISGEFMVLDIENSPQTPWPGDPVSWCVAFEQEVARMLGLWCLDYAGPNVRAMWNWAPLAALGGGLIDPEYNNNGPSSSAPWANVTMWQNADTNISGGDSDVFYGDRATLIAYGTPGAVTQSGTITPIQEAPDLDADQNAALGSVFNHVNQAPGAGLLASQGDINMVLAKLADIAAALPTAVLNTPIPIAGQADKTTTLATEASWNAANFANVPAAVWNAPVGSGNAAGVLNHIDAKPAGTVTNAVAALSAADFAALAKAVNDEADTRAKRRLGA